MNADDTLLRSTVISDFAGRLLGYSRAVVIVVALISLLALWALVDIESRELRLEIDSSVDRLLPDGHPDRAFYNQVKELFGADEVVILALADMDVLTTEGLAAVARLSNALRRLPDLQQLQSLHTVANARNADGMLRVDSFTRMPAATQTQREQLRADLENNSLVMRNLISTDGRMTAFVMAFRGDVEQRFADGTMVTRLRDMAGEAAPDARVLITGGPIIKSALTQAVTKQMRLTIPLILALVAVILLLAFQTLRAVVAPSLTIIIALLWTLAIIAIKGYPLNLVSSIMPPVVITLGLAYTMHMLSEYFVRRRELQDPREAMRKALGDITLPLLLTGITTGAGFLALLLNPLPAVQEFALFSVIGIALVLVLALSFMPAMLMLMDRGGGALRMASGNRLFDSAAGILADFSLRHRRPILYVGSGLLVVSVIATLNINAGTGYVSGFKPDHPVRVDYQEINDRLGGANPFSIVLEGFVADTFVEPEILTAVESFQVWLNQQPEIGSTQSIVDHLKLINRNFNDGDPRFDRIPETRAEAKQLLLFGGGNAINGLVDKRMATTQIMVRATVEDSIAIKALIQRIERQLERLPRRLEATVTGNTVLVTQTVEDIAAGQWLSVGLAGLVVYIILAMLFTSWRIGLLAMLPNLLPVAVYFGTLGVLGITLNPTTSLIACIVLGVAVDDTIHFLVRFNAEARSKGDEVAAAAAALRGVMRPVTFTTIALCAGFMVLSFSELQNQVQFGALAAFTLLIAWFTDVLFTPALSSGVRLVTLWDVLRLDLGHSPQLSIPLLKGLSGRQARTFALLSDLQEVPAGTQLITEGEDARDIFVIVDGELQAWIRRDEQRLNLSVMRRGAVMGEVGLFGSKRTANVDVLSPARLLRFNGDDLERLRRRYPKIAAVIYRNLNLIQAERLTNTMKMVQ